MAPHSGAVRWADHARGVRQAAFRDLVRLPHLGDARFNMGNSLLGVDVRIVAPVSLQPAAEVIEQARAIASETRTPDVVEGVGVALSV